MLNLDLLELFYSLCCLVIGFKKIQDAINILEVPLKDGVYFIHSLSLPGFIWNLCMRCHLL